MEFLFSATRSWKRDARELRAARFKCEGVCLVDYSIQSSAHVDVDVAALNRQLQCLDRRPTNFVFLVGLSVRFHYQVQFEALRIVKQSEIYTLRPSISDRILETGGYAGITWMTSFDRTLQVSAMSIFALAITKRVIGHSLSQKQSPTILEAEEHIVQKKQVKLYIQALE
ncbi:hypothetical protein BO79DRAFT_221405 [Aspergillus costaricaensis CBS 115574]|uniref:Uncharacterized protein n=1 Tax=Aspergillus costaricaensis CBS 115574 TaxID=1448317 RepID=A0ACD1I4Y5_9EURO|nr:hypothetical protein BO79DRAFT_221405 [Aspergillus costaricaensis CBS 115574]RAK84815.1 hypothetical protein BO79DRAFT_221405 [Aspergillus costaricaensis CBS 115574]